MGNDDENQILITLVLPSQHLDGQLTVTNEGPADKNRRELALYPAKWNHMQESQFSTFPPLVFIGIGARKNIFLSFFWWFH
jgi:hypothetical protein